MIDSHFVQTLRVTFLSIGFVLFVVMAVHWIQHISTTKPKLTPNIIAIAPLAPGEVSHEAGHNLQESTLTSFVQATNPSTINTQQPTSQRETNPRQPAPATANSHPAVATKDITTNNTDTPRPAAPTAPSASDQSSRNAPNQTEQIPQKSTPPSSLHGM